MPPPRMACPALESKQLLSLHMPGMAVISSREFQLFLTQWHQDLCAELLTNGSGLLTSRHPKLVAAIPDTFPKLDVLELYFHPVAHDNDLADNPPLSFSCSEPWAVELAAVASTTFQWGRSAKGIFKCYKEIFFPAMAVRQIIQGTVDIDNGWAIVGESCPMIGEIVLDRKVASTCFLPEVWVLLVIPPKLIEDICASLPSSASVIAQIKYDCRKYWAWLPFAMIEVVWPDLIAKYKSSQKKTSSKCLSSNLVICGLTVLILSSESSKQWSVSHVDVSAGSVASTSQPFCQHFPPISTDILYLCSCQGRYCSYHPWPHKVFCLFEW